MITPGRVALLAAIVSEPEPDGGVFVGDTAIDDAYLGSTALSKIYVGTTQMWP